MSRTHRRVTANSRPKGTHRARSAVGLAREPVTILFVTSWLRLFRRAEHFLTQATAPARAAVWFLAAALRHSPPLSRRNSLSRINTLKLCKCCKSLPLACENSRTKTLDTLTQISSLRGNYAASSVLRSSPPLVGPSVLSASRLYRLYLFP